MTSESDEYQKVAALVCMDIDTILSAAERNPDMALDLLRLLKEKKDKVISDKGLRDMRYGATQMVFSVATKQAT